MTVNLQQLHDLLYFCVGVCTFLAELMVRSVEVVDGVNGVEFDLREVFVTDPVKLRCGLGGRRPWHVASTSGDVQLCRLLDGPSTPLVNSLLPVNINWWNPQLAAFEYNVWMCVSQPGLWTKWIDQQNIFQQWLVKLSQILCPLNT